MEYRKLPGRLHEWHNNPQCPDWPESGYLEHERTPEDHEICSKCIELTEAEAKSK
jgi:hypothetical protein